MSKPWLKETTKQTIKENARKTLMQMPGVKGFAFSRKGLEVYVVDTDAGKRMPKEFMGAPVIVVVTGNIVALRA